MGRWPILNYSTHSIYKIGAICKNAGNQYSIVFVKYFPQSKELKLTLYGFDVDRGPTEQNKTYTSWINQALKN